jgi:muramoyltetrapeptide carboxypeptidase
MRVGIFALSGPFERQPFEAGLQLLREAGFAPELAPGVFERRGYLAGDDRVRVEGLEALLDDPDLSLLMAARGGYGIHRVLPRIPHRRMKGRCVAGFSDVTALHCARFAADGAWGLHCAVVTQLHRLSEPALAATLAALSHPEAGCRLVGSPGFGPAVEGTVVGGNLALLGHLVGTPHLRWPPDPILLLEDVSEAPYRLDRMLTHLELTGLPDRVRGVAVGRFEGCRGPADGPEGHAVVAERLERWKVPVVFDLPVGHGPDNHPVPVGRKGRLEPGTGRLEVLPC